MQITELLDLSVKSHASDLHISPGLSPILRINGDLAPIKEISVLDAEMTKSLIYSVMNKEQQQLFESNLELDFAINFPNMGNFRVNAFKQAFGLAAVFRVIPDKIPTLDELQMPSLFKQLLELPNGLILVTGPSGSGKSTTLAAMLDYINRNHAMHVITIEDPIEFTHHSKKSLIHQRQIHRDTHSFSAALRAALREDPDVIMVGEMRDLETIRLALTAAETGHLVMATLHTSSAAQSVSRIVDVFPAKEKHIIRNMFAGSIRAVICQTLIKRVSDGRVAALEIMLGTTATRNLIREDKIAQLYSIIQTGSGVGMCTLDQSLQELVMKKIISADTAREVAVKAELFPD